LLLKAAVADFPQPVEEHSAGQRVAGFAFVQTGMDAAAQFYALQPVQDKQRALDPPQLAQGDSQTILARVAAQFPEPQRGRHGALLDRGGQPQNFVPVDTDMLDVGVVSEFGSQSTR